MGQDTKIQWCDSSANLQSGCDGCELWQPQRGVKICYAGRLTERYGGRAGWPDSFDKPKEFPHRLDAALKWSDLTGKDRPDKPWLNGYPRTIFLDDMGDTFTESLPDDWLAKHLERMAASKHVWILLTKRPSRMAAFFTRHPVPANFWLCASITNRASLGRIGHLLKIEGASVLGLSVEPLWEEIDLGDVAGAERLSWVKIGGQSGPGAVPCQVDWIRRLVSDCRWLGITPFVKQLGSAAFAGQNRLALKDSHGGAWMEWPEDLRVRELPVNYLTPTLAPG